jgi:purine-binding chemotaxis protein CheW
VAGVANLRGHIYSVTDLQKFLHLNNGQGSEGKGEILMIKTQKMRLALRVDEVRSVEMIQESRIKPAADTIHGVKPEFIRGVIEDYEISDGEKIPVLVLNLDSLLSDESLVVHEEFV